MKHFSSPSSSFQSSGFCSILWPEINPFWPLPLPSANAISLGLFLAFYLGLPLLSLSPSPLSSLLDILVDTAAALIEWKCCVQSPGDLSASGAWIEEESKLTARGQIK